MSEPANVAAIWLTHCQAEVILEPPRTRDSDEHTPLQGVVAGDCRRPVTAEFGGWPRLQHVDVHLEIKILISVIDSTDMFRFSVRAIVVTRCLYDSNIVSKQMGEILQK